MVVVTVVTVVVCDAVVVVVVNDVGEVVVADGDGMVAVVVVISGLSGARITNFNSKPRATANIVRTIKQMNMILTQR